MAPVFGAIREEYAALWRDMALHPSWVRAFQREAQRILRNRARYESVAAVTHVPWFVIGLIHSMESGLDFDTHLHNGDPLTERTVQVPRGRPPNGSPPFRWEDSAIDALQYDNLTSVSNWCIEQIAFTLEAYNGWGYRYKQLPTPYLWSGTNNYVSGKYIRDGHFDPKAVSEQTGAMAILSVMHDLQPDIHLTYFNGSDAAHEPATAVLPPDSAAREKKSKSTIPADTVTVASGVAAVAANFSHTPAPASSASAAPALPATPAPAASQPAPTIIAKPAASLPPSVPAAKAQPSTTSTVQPAHPDMIDTYYPFIIGGLLVLFVLGVFLSWRARSGRARSPQTFASALPKMITCAASDRDLASAPLVDNMRTRLLTTGWILVTIAINAIALAKLLQYFQLAQVDWYPPFSSLGDVYDALAGQAFAILADAARVQIGFDITPWPWLMPFIVLYLSTASAFMAANSGLVQRKTSAETLWGATVHAGWLLSLPAFLLDALRYRVVDRFARQNTVLFFGYIAAFAFAYVGARFINDDFLATYIHAHPGISVKIDQSIQKGARPMLSAATH